MEYLIGHTSPETAYVVNDYPYGFRLRCKIRYWLEHKPKQGYRFVSQTTNPKVAGEVWNKPKASVYSLLEVLVLQPANDKGIREVASVAIGQYDVEDKLEAFVLEHAEALQGETEQKVIAAWRAAIERVQTRRRFREFEAKEKAEKAAAETTKG